MSKVSGSDKENIFFVVARGGLVVELRSSILQAKDESGPNRRSYSIG